METAADTGFLASKHGFPFPNCYPPGSPVVELPTPFGRITLGDASGGLCGGMVFAALDFYLTGVACPAVPTDPVYRYLCRRLLDSWNLPFGVLRYFDWQRRPGASRRWAGVRVQDGVARLTIEEEWPKVKAWLDRGQPAPLGLVKAHSFSPRQLPKNHQVLALGYRLEGDDLTVRVYDPNHPGDDTTTLALSLRDPEAEATVTHNREGARVRGFFLTEYSRPQAWPELEEGGA